jgi:serine/threonine protein kinase
MTKNIELLKKEFIKIPFRINFIKKLLDDNDLNSLVKFDATNTEAFTGGKNNSYDIRNKLEKQLLDFSSIMKKLNSRLTYIKSGTTGHTFKGIKSDDEDGTINFAVKVVAYPKKGEYGDVFDIKRPENAELLMLRVLSYFILKRQTPHIILPIGTFNTKIDTFVNINKRKSGDKKVIQSKKYDEFVKRCENGEFYNVVSILLSEWANGGDLADYIRYNKKEMSLITWKVLFFQLLSVLAIIQKKYPAFRHNDLKANNILIHRIQPDECWYKYSINGITYEHPNIGIQIKLWDFDFSCIPGLVDNSKVYAKWSDRINIKPIENKYYDIHYFFNTLTKRGFFPELFDADYVPDEVKSFIKRVVPLRYAKGDFVDTKGGRILVNDEYTTPDKLLRSDEFFSEFRI